MWSGLKLTLKHLFNAIKSRKPISIENANYFDQQNGIVTLQYPREVLPVPDNGRYRLHNEIDDCIVCDLCAKICPVDCIDIEAVKSTEEIGKTSDGSTKRLYAAIFDIDMAKCCYCGLCTTVCPTECLTMTKTYDFSEFDVTNMNYHFSDLTPQQVEEKKQLYEESQRIKAELKRQKESDAAKKAEGEVKEAKAPTAFKPVIKPTIAKPAVTKPTEEFKEDPGKKTTPSAAKPIIKPLIKPVVPAAQKKEEENKPESAKKPIIKPVFRPKNTGEENNNADG